jgi:hypothetical protein
MTFHFQEQLTQKSGFPNNLEGMPMTTASGGLALYNRVSE